MENLQETIEILKGKLGTVTAYKPVFAFHNGYCLTCGLGGDGTRYYKLEDSEWNLIEEWKEEIDEYAGE